MVKNTVKNEKLNILLEYSIPLSYTLKAMSEYQANKVEIRINEKRAEMLDVLKTLQKLQQKEKYCVKNYENFIDTAVNEGLNLTTMSEKDCEKFFRLGGVINTVLVEQKKVAQKLESFHELP